MNLLRLVRSHLPSRRFSTPLLPALVCFPLAGCGADEPGSRAASSGGSAGVALGGQSTAGAGGQSVGSGGFAAGGVGAGGFPVGSGGDLSAGGSGTGGLGMGGMAAGGMPPLASGGGPGAGGNGAGGAGSGGMGSGGMDPMGSGGDTGTGGAPTETCPLPATFQWTSTGPLAEPKNPGAKSLKDFSVTKYNGKYLVYATTADGNWNGFMSTFTSFDEWANVEQRYIRGLVAPTIFYFTPKDTWVLAYQWGFKYATSKTPDNPSSWSSTQPLLNGDPTGGRGTGPIDQTIICDDANCYIFFNDDAGGVYRGSMPIGQFPGAFTNVTRIMNEPTSVIFEGIQVYSVRGSNQYLMIIENNGTRAFRAWTATDLGGQWTPLAGASSTQQPFAGQANVTWPGGKWTNDISHGDLVRENPSEKMEIDPCNLQMLYQGRDPNVNVSYADLPYRPGLLTLQR